MWQHRKNKRQNKKWKKCAESWSSWSSAESWSSCYLVTNQYQQKPEVLYTFNPNKSYAYLLNVEPSNLVFLKTYDTDFDEIIITFTDENGKLLKIEDKVNLILFVDK